MAQVNKISSFKSFTEVKNQEATMKLRETNNAKRQETVGKIGAILDEMGLTSLSELDEEKKQALINKMFGNVSEDEAEDIEDELNKLGEPKELEEGNAFIYAAAKAKNSGKKEFSFNGKTYKVTLKTDTGLKEDNSIEESAVNEARTISKIQYDWSKLTTSMQATAQNWKAAEGSAKESLLGKLKEMTAQKKALETELNAAIADKDKDIELVVTESKEADEASNILDDLLGERDMEELHGMSIEDALDTVETYGHSGSKAKKIAQELYSLCNESTVSEAFNRLPKDVIGNELYLASKNLTNLFNSANAGNDIDPGVIDSIVKQLNTVKKSVKKFNNYDEVAGTVYEGKAKDLKPNHKYTSDYGEVTFIKLNPDGKTMKLHSKETGEIKTDRSNAYNMELIESVVSEGTKQFDKDVETVIKDIKSGYGWIDPEYVSDTWENSSNTIDYSLVKGEVLKRLFDAGLLAHADENDEEVAGKKVKFSELGAYANESVVNEAEKFKSTQDFEEFCEEIDGMPEVRIKRIMGKDYIDTPGGYRDEAEDYDNDIIEYMISNMGRSNFEELKTWWENNVAESTVTESGFHRSDPSAEATSRAEQLKKLKETKARQEKQERLKKLQAKRAKVNEAEVKSDDEFKEYAMTVLKKAFKDDFDEAKATKVVDGILKKCGDDYGAAVGMITASLGESVVTEAFDADKRVVELAKLLKKQKFIGSVYPEGDTIKVFVDSGDTGTTMMWDDSEPGKVRMECEDDSYSETIDDNNAAILNFFENLDDELDESVTEAFDANYWEDYHEDAPKINNPSGMQIQQEVEAAVENWNDNNEMGEENEVTSAGEKKVLKLAKEYAKAKGYICHDVIDAMIAQES